MTTPPAVTFDVYSALLDSRTGGSRALAARVRADGLAIDPEELFGRWDRRNKRLHRTTSPFASFRQLAHDAMRQVFDEVGLDGDPARATEDLLASMRDWPAWPDVDEGLRTVARQHRVALLSNIDDDLLAATEVCPWVEQRITSAQVRVYKPHAGIYRAARQRLGDDLVHVPASARDTRGALEAGMRVVRVRRPGHHVDPDGPRPDHEVDDLRELPGVLASLPAPGMPA
ncbi:HAD-IA family hydrolase [Egicoccus sp. AB-alg2]|uniref:HAD-IA family hydrolase n=1 Tax=Egicoccus sp. AB-alg2 TaxID=3242693 RepID=UPI00359DEF70